MAEPDLVPVPLPGEDRALPFWEHVGELRERLIRAVAVLAAATAAAYVFRVRLWELAQRPLLATPALRRLAFGGPFAYADLSEPFFSLMRLSFWAAVFAASPFLFYQVWAFVRPALREEERRWASVFVAATTACFVAGALFAYFVAFPVLCGVLVDEAARAGLRPNLRPGEYLDLLLYAVLGTAVSFEAPVLFYFLGRFGLVTSRAMLARWREAFIAVLAASALLTPGDVVVTTFLFGGVLLALYFVSAAVVRAVERP